MKKTITFSWQCLLLLLISSAARADVTLPRLLSDGVVLQRNAPTAIWGWADEGEVVTIYLDGESAATATTENGTWKVHLAEQGAGGPHQITVTGSNMLIIDDVYFGDVWVASGQSNMQLPIERVKERFMEDIAAANYPLIREFEVPRKYDFKEPQVDVESGSWKSTTPQTVMGFSAVAYFFAKSVHEEYGVPIGIISSNFGGSAAEGWMTEQALEEYPHYLDVARSFQDDEYLQGLIDSDQAVADDWYANLDSRDEGLAEGKSWSAENTDDADWQEMNVPGYWMDTDVGAVNGVVWFRKTIELPESVDGMAGKLMLGRIVDADTTYVNGVKVGNITYMYPPRRYEVSAGILKAGKNTIAIRVVNNRGKGGFYPDKPYWLQVGDTRIDLQGPWRFRVGAVSDSLAPQKFVRHRQPLGFYNAMLAPVQDMRIKGVIWYQGETNVGRAEEYTELFPAMIRNWREEWQQGDFPFLFVQLANFLPAREAPQESVWAELRDAQRQSLRVANTAMAVAIDAGEWNDIHPLDKKTVGERLAVAARSVAYGEADLLASGPTFRNLVSQDGQLMIHFDDVGEGLLARGGALKEFAVAGSDGVYHWAEAIIDGSSIIVSSDAVTNPMSVRYAWADNPSSANLYNSAGLPASPFQAALRD